MAQPAQIFSNDLSNQQYMIIDNSAAPTFPTARDASGEYIGYDNVVRNSNNLGGANNQGSVFATGANGSVPDFVNAQTQKTMAGTANKLATPIGFKNPS